MPRICIIPKAANIGGVTSFQHKLAAGLARRGVEVCHDLGDTPYDALLLTGGTRQLFALWRARRRGVRVVQRLDGINWIHRRRRTGWRHYLRAEYGNRLLAFIRTRIASQIAYQSEFVRGWWEDWFGAARAPSVVIHNGVDLETYSPVGRVSLVPACPGGQARAAQAQANPPEARYRLLIVEGSLGGGYDMGLEWAVRLAESLAENHKFPMELMVVGRLAPQLQSAWQKNSRIPILWAGTLPGERIPEIDRSAHLLFSADLNSACPNSVIEALACGLPVVAFSTGALPELVTGDSGRLVTYGGNPWRIDPPDLPALAAAAAEILADLPRFRKGARARAEAAFGLDRMVEGYLQILLNS
ncbi:MAG: glycosyltransferase family 4 protein [Anaerolineales bacterium]|nr:glycosyltransferase family 4 protein [Anaerolineales bacterium]MDP3185218.1 glycosyltransferase family 4 protein [Anaerolineales bacterium]